MSLENFPSAGVQGMLQGQLQSTESGQLSRVSEDDDHCRFLFFMIMSGHALSSSVAPIE